jgi:hypothetical protein
MFPANAERGAGHCVRPASSNGDAGEGLNGRTNLGRLDSRCGCPRRIDAVVLGPARPEARPWWHSCHASRFHVPKAISQTSPSGRQSKRALPFN